MRVYWRKKETFGTRFFDVRFFVKLFVFWYFAVFLSCILLLFRCNRREEGERRGVIMGRLSEKLGRIVGVKLFIRAKNDSKSWKLAPILNLWSLKGRFQAIQRLDCENLTSETCKNDLDTVDWKLELIFLAFWVTFSLYEKFESRYFAQLFMNSLYRGHMCVVRAYYVLFCVLKFGESIVFLFVGRF